jgi:hypothetical protein
MNRSITRRGSGDAGAQHGTAAVLTPQQRSTLEALGTT